MNDTPSLSIITLTKNRPKLLDLCLGSLEHQVLPTDEVIVVNNGNNSPARKITEKHRSALPIRYFVSKKKGYSQLYNYAIRQCLNDIIVFLDDDCVAGRNFVYNIRKAHLKHKDCVIQGVTYSIPAGNIYADIMGDHYENWLLCNKNRNGYMQTLDNKNASLPRSLLVQHGAFSDACGGGSEDIEMGIRYRRQGVKILLKTSVVAYHHEQTTLRGFLRQHLRIARSHGVLDKMLPKEEQHGLFQSKKTRLNIASAQRRWKQYLSEKKTKEAALLPALYFLLGLVRAWGYITAK